MTLGRSKAETFRLGWQPDGQRSARRWGADYIWLVYAVFFFFEPAMRRSALYWAENLAIFAAFLPLYVWFVETRTARLRLPLVGAIALFGVATIPFNQGGSFFFIFAAALVPFTVSSMRLACLLLMAESVVVAAEWALLGRENSVNFGSACVLIYVVGLANLFIAEQKRAACRLQAAQEENAALAAVAERERIARDLHDVLGHTLSVIVLKAELAKKLMERDPVRAATEIADVESTARTALAEVREAIGGYRSQSLHAELTQARRALDAAGVALTLAEIEPGLPIHPEAQTVLSLTLREAVTNIVRHAHATHCRVSVTQLDGKLALTVEDDGQHLAPREGNGLRGMRERVQRIGGQFSLDTGDGTRVRVELPAGGTV